MEGGILFKTGAGRNMKLTRNLIRLVTFNTENDFHTTTIQETIMANRNLQIANHAIRSGLILFVFIFFLVACTETKPGPLKTTTEETPESLGDNDERIKSYSQSDEPYEQLYLELVKINPELEKLENDIKDYNNLPDQVTSSFDTYKNKSNRYYQSARYKAASISDSTLRIRITNLLEKSASRFSASSDELNSLLKQIKENDHRIHDKHSVLKMVLSLSMIEKYQADNKPDMKPFTDLIKSQKALAQQVDSLTPDF